MADRTTQMRNWLKTTLTAPQAAPDMTTMLSTYMKTLSGDATAKVKLVHENAKNS